MTVLKNNDDSLIIVRIIRESCPNNSRTLSASHKNLVRKLQELCPKLTRIIIEVVSDVSEAGND